MGKFFKTDQRYVLQEDYDALVANIDGAWTQTTASVTASIGTFTSVNGIIRYKKIGTTVHAYIGVNIVNAGTAAGVMLVGTLPYASVASSISIGTCREVAANGSSGTMTLSGGATSLLIVFYNNTSVITTGWTIVGNITYETSP